MDIINIHQWSKDCLTPPETDVPTDTTTTSINTSIFLNRILNFNKRVELSNWLSCESAECMTSMSKSTGQNIEDIRDTLQVISWSHDMCAIHVDGTVSQSFGSSVGR